MSSFTEASILSPALFDQYTADWVKFVGSASSDILQKLFAAPSGSWLPFVSISQQQLVGLLSTPNLHRIKVRFLLLPGGDDKQARFSAALYATDETDLRTSAYYLAASPWQAAGPPLEGSVPKTLADTWVANWTTTKALLPAMFQTDTLPLEGYNYEVADFMDPLFAVQSLQDVTLRLNFGLHAYYPATDAPGPAQLLGLVLRLNTPGSADAGTAALYDMGLTVPPGA